MQRSELQGFRQELLMDYTKGGLMKREDILPAFSGIAAQMQSFHNSRYSSPAFGTIVSLKTCVSGPGL
jgi:hypothetical protein